MTDQTTPAKTVLYDLHVEAGAKMAPFGGFTMPIQYDGIMREHLATRKKSAVFDTCHMGEFRIRGADAVTDLERIVSCPVGSMEVGQCRYGFICNERGGVIDDQILYRMGEHEFFMVVNAATCAKDLEWIHEHVSELTLIEDLSDRTAKIDLQGPTAPRIMQAIMDEPLEQLKYYRFTHNHYQGERVLTSRTGYTGEVGFEIYCDPDLAESLWNDCIGLGAVPAGLGARDTLRLEMGFPLYGHELDEDRNPAETGFSRAIDDGKEFIGSDVVLDPAAAREVLVGIELEGRRAARSGDPIKTPSGEEIGVVTSGSFAPSLEKAVAMGYILRAHSAEGTGVLVETDRQKLQATITGLPFYKNATARKPLADFL